MIHGSSTTANSSKSPQQEAFPAVFSSFQHVVEALDTLGMDAADLGIGRIQSVLAHLGGPQNQVPCIHVVGTNGKGSQCALLDALYTAAGYKTGRFVSPHLVQLRERLRVGGELISEAQFLAVANQVQSASISVGVQLSYFEFITAVGFLWFQQSGVQVALVEAGLGGRLDATNVIDRPLAVVVTPISLDHMALLGPTVEAIATEKMQVFRPEVPVISGPQPHSVRALLSAHAQGLQAPFVQASVQAWTAGGLVNTPVGSLRSLLYSPEGEASAQGVMSFVPPGPYLCGLLGAYQAANVAVAMQVVAVLQALLPVSSQAVEAGLAQAQWPGRYQWVPQCGLLLDGSHNEAGLQALVEDVERDFSQHTFIWGLSAKANRPLSQFSSVLAMSQTVAVVPLVPPSPQTSFHSPAAVGQYCQQWAQQAGRSLAVFPAMTPAAFLAQAQAAVEGGASETEVHGQRHQSQIHQGHLHHAHLHGALHGVTGSLYTVGEFLKQWPPFAPSGVG